jgi:hypothetical protein
MSRFTPVPSPPQAGIDPWQSQILSAIKENVDLLTGLRGEKDGASQAVLKSSITIRALAPQQMQRVSAQVSGVTANGVAVPTLSDYAALVRDVQTLANDVANLRSAVETLISQLRG